MQFYYGEKMPLRVLDEAEFWKHQEAEHTVVIRELVPNLEPKFDDALQKWEQSFSQAEALVRRYIETIVRSGNKINHVLYQQIMGLVDYCLYQSQQFILFLNQMAQESKALSGNQTAIVVLNHIRRESEYFIGVAQTVIYGK
jgi:hypothetical protein